MKVLDLFCGCGGFSTGFLRAGFDIKYGIDFWEGCKKTYEYNHPGAEFILKDIMNLEPQDFKSIDIVIGSPPCPEFSTAKRNPNPQKGMILVNKFREWINIIKPKYWILENVPGIKQFLESKLYSKIKILNSANFGVPQGRIRCFAGNFIIPRPTHSKTPVQTLDGRKLKKWVTIKESINDLVELRNWFSLKNLIEEIIKSKINKKILSKCNFLKSYLPIPQNPNFKSLTTSNVKNWKTFEEKKNKFQKYNKFAKTITCFGSPAYYIQEDQLVEILDTPMSKEIRFQIGNNFFRPQIDELQKIIKNKKETSFLIKNTDYRKLTIREKARLQSFPDDFVFFGNNTNCRRIIGNAVPPKMSYHLARAIKKQFNNRQKNYK